MTRSRGARGMRASKISTSGQSTSRMPPSTELDLRARGLEVVEVLGVDAREALGADGGAEELQGGRRRVSRVVPTGERADDRRGPKAIRTVSQFKRLHPDQGTSWASCLLPTSTPFRHPRRRSPRCVPATTSRRLRLHAQGSPDRAHRHAVPRMELRDRSGAIGARVFRDADLMAGRFDRGDLVRVSGRVERFRDELQLEVAQIARAPRTPTPPRSCRRLPRPRRARRLPRAPGRRGPRAQLQGCSRACSPTSELRAALRRSPHAATATTPTSAGCSSTRSRSRRSPSRPALCIRASTRTCCSARRWSTTSGAPAS